MNLGPALSQFYTASQLARTLGLSKQSVLRGFNGCPPSGSVIVAGNPAHAWAADALPARWRESLATKARLHGVSVAEFLDGFVKPWTPPVPLGEVSAECLAETTRLRDALLRALQRLDSTRHDSGERWRLGLAEYRQAVGHDVTERHWRRLMERIVMRDGGARNFNRLELFLPERPARPAAAPCPLPGDEPFAALAESLQGFRNPTAPTRTETAAFWSEIFDFYEAHAETPRTQRALRRGLIRFLFRSAPWLARTPHALRVAFERKYERWAKHGRTAAALLDGREEKRGVPTADPIPQEDVDIMVGYSAFLCGTRTTQAIRELGQQGEKSGLTPPTLAAINNPHKRKSHVNRRVSSVVSRDAKSVEPYLLGKKAVADATASNKRDWSLVSVMHTLSADDFTMPVYCFVPDGKGWWQLTRGQCLIMVDARSRRVLQYSFQPERNYNALVIRTLMNRTCREWGLPKKWYFENGIWKNALLVKGAPSEWRAGKSWLECKPGWGTLGVKFCHAKTARSKPHIENIGGMIQNLMERMPGYCGRDERRDCPEITKRNKLAVEARRVEPHGLFLSFDAWDAELGKLMEVYNAAIQDGDTIGGMSPNQAFQENFPQEEMTKLDSKCWHLLAHYVSERKVGVEGIKFKLAGEDYIYRDANTSPLRGQTVLAWFDPECPEVLGVTDLNERNPVLVSRARKTDPNADDKPGTPEHRVLQEERAKVAAHSAYPLARYHTLKAKFTPTFRKNLVAPEVAEVAAEFSAKRQSHATAQKEQTAQTNKARRAAGKLGLALPADGRVDAEAAAALARLQERFAADDDTIPAPEETL